MFTEWGGVRSSPSLPLSLSVMEELVTLCSWARKSTRKCIWNSDKLHLPHHLLQKKKKKKEKSFHEHINRDKGWSHNLSPSNRNLALCWHECLKLTDYEPAWYIRLPQFKNSERRKPSEDTLSYRFLSCAHILLFSFIFLSEKLCQRTGWGRLCSSNSLWISVRRFHTTEKLNNNCKKSDYLQNVMFLWMSHSGDSLGDDYR